MSKVITFSRTFPSYHPRKGEPTYFVEKILNQIGVDYNEFSYLQKLLFLNTKNLASGKLSYKDLEQFSKSLKKVSENKLHTIRNGNRFKDGESFSPRCWFGKPYNSPQIIFWDDLKVEKTFDFEIKKYAEIIINGKFFYQNGYSRFHFNIEELAKRDGLSCSDLFSWFKYRMPYEPFDGQIISWDKNINY